MAGLYKRSNSPHWQAIWVCPDTGKKRRRSTGSSVKREAKRIAESWEQIPGSAELPKKKSLSTLIDIWLAELISLGRSHKHICQRRRALSRLGVEVSHANTVLGDHARDEIWSDQTIHTYYISLKQFGKWCVMNGHRDRDPMIGLKKPSRQTGRRYIRGVMTQSQASILCSHHLIPESRRLVYRTALSTGLRVGELRAFSAENLRVIKGKMCIHLKPKQVKNRFESFISISSDLAADLMKGLDMRPFRRAAQQLREDLKQAGLPLKDEDDHPFDFHSLRATFGDLLIKRGIAIPTVARLMRHSDGGTLLLKRYSTSESGGACNAIQDYILQMTNKYNLK